MLDRIRVNHYKGLERFDFKPRPLQLVLGNNGLGKSTIFDVLSQVRRFITDISAVYEESFRQCLTHGSPPRTSSLG